MIAAIFLNGYIENYRLIKKYAGEIDFFIGVDGGINHLEKMNINPNILIGDFDSYNDLGKYNNTKKIILDADKDYTDGEVAINYVIENDFDKVYIFGAIGKRIDHVLSNIYLLEKLNDNSVTGIIVNSNNVVYFTDNKIEISGKKGEFFSVIPYTDSIKNVIIKGARYDVYKETFHRGSSYGMSNEFLDDKVKIEFDDGKAFIIKAKD